MAELQWQQRAIVVIDLVESVRLMQANAADVIERWRQLDREVRATALTPHAGRMVKSLGDGMLLEFATPRAAVAAALQIRRLTAGLNVGRSQAEAMVLRMGIHVGDVVVDELDVYGPMVNVTARLAAAARPGDIVTSAAVREQIVAGLDADLEDLGELYLKHIEHPVRAYRLSAPGAMPRSEMPAADTAGLKPGIAVIPFKPSSPDPAFAAVGHALADDINAALARSSELRVISRLSAAAFSDGHWPLTEVRARLGVAYVLSGAYHVIGQRVRLSVELCDARDDRVIWATGLSSGLEEIFNSQDRLVPEIVSQIGRQVLAAELERTGRIPVPSLEGYSLYLGGVGLLHRLTGADFRRSRELLEHVSERQPRAAAPHAMLAKWHILRMVQGWSTDPLQEAGMARASARKAVDLDGREAFALTADGLVAVLVDGDLEAGADRYAQAIEANPHEPYAWALMSGLHTYREQPALALEAAERALSLSPLDPARFLFESYLAFATLGAGRYDEAAACARSSLRLNAMHAASHRLLVMALALAGRGDEARQAAIKLLAVDPGCTVSGYRKRYPAKDSKHGELYATALQEAGVPA